jgi:hypothetical protein
MVGGQINVSRSALRFMEKHGIKDVTFRLKVMEASGCCLGIVKEIEPEYRAPKDASRYYYFRAGDRHVFVSREIKILGRLTLTTEGIWKMRRLALDGATIPL